MNAHIRFSYFPHMTHVRYLLLKKYFGSLEAAWDASAKELRAAKWPEQLITQFIAWKNAFHVQEAQAILEKEHISTVALDEEHYPSLLKEVYDPPLCLFVRGDIKKITKPIAVVGSRKFSTYGKFATTEFVTPLSQQGMSIVSGLALGIDSIAHEAALAAQGHTIAVLGGGIDDATIAPRQHISLAKKIIRSGGALISEYPPRTVPTKYSFPKRNRIIAGLSLGTLVMEAGEKSGALITAQYALDTHREVFALPNPITSLTGIGTNTLIKQGAHLVTTHSEILETLHLPDCKNYATNKEILPNSEEESTLLHALSREGKHIDKLIRDTALPSSLAMSTLSLMEMKGMVTNLGNMTYIKNQ